MQRLTAFLDERVDGQWLGIARIILGLAAVCKGVVAGVSVYAYQNGDYLSFPYTRFELAAPSGITATVVSVAWIIFALFFMVGFGTRLSGALLAAAIFLTIGIDQQLYSNHLYLLGSLTVLMTIAGPGARYSIDARRGLSDPTVPRWAVTLIMLQLTSVYFFAALSKLNDGFLSGAVIERSFEPSMRDRIEQVISLEFLAVLAIGTELFLAFIFWSARGRLFALPVALGFHIVNVAIMDRGIAINLSIFALIMLSMMLVYFTDQEIRLTQRAQTTKPRPEEPVTAAP